MNLSLVKEINLFSTLRYARVFKKLLLLILLAEAVVFGLFFFQGTREVDLLTASVNQIVEKGTLEKVDELRSSSPFAIARVIEPPENQTTSSFSAVNLSWQAATLQAPWSKRDAHTVVVFDNKIWLLGGVGGSAPDYSQIKSDIWVLQNGKDWILITKNAPWGPRRAHNSVVFQNKIWLLAGVTKNERYLNDVWSSSDGKNWVQITKNADFTPRKGFASVVFDNKIWVMGGVDTKGAVNDVWYSENGKDWFLATNSASWSPRYDLAAEVFEDKIWLSGGVLPGEMGKNDIWVSENGADWQKIEEKMPWPGRHGHCLISFQNYLWVIGGWSGYGKGYNDVWFSSDGIFWQKTAENAPWPGREDLACVVFGDEIFMIAGMLTNGQRTNDVWRSIETEN